MLNGLFQNTLGGWQWGLLALVPPAIIALYFLKLKRVPLEIPSTYLWQRAIEDLHVNSFWQRLRRNLLLLLQLLIIALAIFALLRPGWHGTALEGERFIFLVDNSASMSATDTDQDNNRLAEAKRRVLALIGQMKSGMSAMIISFADTPYVVQEFTDNRRLLRERLETIESTARTTDLKGALELAGGLANPARMIIEEDGVELDISDPIDATVYILTDGRFEDVSGFSLGNLEPIFVPIGTTAAENLAISALSTRRNELRPESQQAFVQITSFADQTHTASLGMYLDDDFLDARDVRVPAGESAGAVFTVPTGRLGDLRMELSVADVRDRLALDDVAYAPVNDLRAGRVLLITPGNDWLVTAVSTDRAMRISKIDIATPDILAKQEYKRQAEVATYDLIIFDQCAPPAQEWMPRTNTLFIGQLPPVPKWQRAEEVDPRSGMQILVWNQQHPIMADIDLGNIQLVDSMVLDLPPGATNLIESTQGPIAAIAPRDSYEDCVLGFEIVGTDEEGNTSINTNWPTRHSFPTFWLNMLEYFTASRGQTAVGSVRPGEPIALRSVSTAEALSVSLPDGTTQPVRRDNHGVFQFQDTFLLGNYVVRDGEQVVDRFAVNLFDRAESDIRLTVAAVDDGGEYSNPSLKIGHVDVAGQRAATPERKELWKWLLLGALAVLLFEWYIYNRRVYI